MKQERFYYFFKSGKNLWLETEDCLLAEKEYIIIVIYYWKIVKTAAEQLADRQAGGTGAGTPDSAAGNPGG